MKKLSLHDYKTFEQIVSLTDKGLLKTMSSFLKQKYTKVVTTNQYVYAEGTIPVVLVAHLDTVFKTPVKDMYYDSQKNVMWSPDGLGADDRAGVFSIIQILKSGFHPHVILTMGEEDGCLGAKALVAKEKECPLVGVKFLIELDRRDSNDCVFYDCNTKDFMDFIETFGYVTAFGSFSDISVLSHHWKKCAVNLSIGYRDEHDYTETLHVGDMFRTIGKVKEILNYVSEHADMTPFVYTSVWDSKEYRHTWYKGMKNLKPYSELVEDICENCGISLETYDSVPIVSTDGLTTNVCVDCFATLGTGLQWCEQCGNPFFPSEQSTTICAHCLMENNNDGGITFEHTV